MKHNSWGERRASTRAWKRRLWIAGVAAVMLALPFALHFGSKHYAAAGGTMPDGRFPLWIPVSFWITTVTVALAGMLRLYRLSDEFERRRLIDAGAAAGLLLILLMPPVFFLGLLDGGGVMLVWLGAVAIGLTLAMRPRSYP